MRAKILLLLTALLVVTITSAIFAIPSVFIFGEFSIYLSTFGFIFSLQLIFGGLWNYYIYVKENIELKKIDSANKLAEAVQQVPINCAYCTTSNLVNILIGEENTFKCDACTQENNVKISYVAVRTTKPIMPKQEAAEIFKNL